jgi:Holliday junction resolvase
MGAHKRATDEQIMSLYREHRSINAVAKALGFCPQSVHERLVKLGIHLRDNGFTEHEVELIKAEYIAYRNGGKLDELCQKLNRPKTSVVRFAKSLGLTSQVGPKPFAGKWKYMTEDAARVMMDDFKSTNVTLSAFCRARGYADVCFWKTMTRFFPDEWEHVIESKAPKTSHYRRGRGFEYSVRNDLRALGFFCMRSPASKSPIDLVAIRKNCVAFIQCKIGGQLSPAEWNEFLDLSESVGAVPILACRKQIRLIQYFRIIARKDGSKARQPMQPLEIQELVQAAQVEIREMEVANG